MRIWSTTSSLVSHVQAGVLDKKFVHLFTPTVGELVGFTDLGSVNSYLSDLEEYLEKVMVTSAKPIAKTMLVIMVRGLNSGFQFPYTQFPCANLRGDHVSHFLEGCWSFAEIWLQGDGAYM